MQRQLEIAQADPSLEPHCPHCALIENAPTDHWPITRLSVREWLLMWPIGVSVILTGPDRGKYSVDGKVAKRIQRVEQGAMAKGNYSWVRQGDCRLASRIRAVWR